MNFLMNEDLFLAEGISTFLTLVNLLYHLSNIKYRFEIKLYLNEFKAFSQSINILILSELLYSVFSLQYERFLLNKMSST